MASTSLGIPLADGNTIVDPIQTPLNAIANGANTAIRNAVAAIDKGYYIGTNAERGALTASGGLRNGITWYATDTNVVWRRASGTWVPDTPFRMAVGIAEIGTSFPQVNFPAGRFTRPPVLVAQIVSGAGADIPNTRVMVTNITSTSFQARHTGASGERTIHWQAFQMTSGSAQG